MNIQSQQVQYTELNSECEYRIMKEEKKWIILSSSAFISLGSTFEAYGFRLSAGKAYGSSFNVTNWMFSAGNMGLFFLPFLIHVLKNDL